MAACLLTSAMSFAQLGAKKQQFTHADTLRGSLNENRDWWDVQYYTVNVVPDYEHKTIRGITTLFFKKVKTGSGIMQVDLQQPLEVDSVVHYDINIRSKGEPAMGSHLLSFTRDGNTLLVTYKNEKESNNKYGPHSITVYYHGQPKEAVRPPWDGGWIWKKDAKGRPWMSVAVQGLGASAWYPCKDYQGDEPDRGATLHITVPDTLVAVGNGRLVNEEKEKGLAMYTWKVVAPINNYTIVPYIGKYVNFTDTLMGEKGKLDLSYWVLDYNLEKAKEQFKQVKLMLRAFEYWFGPYPFYEDGYKLVEAPHLGMEHQSAVAYGNRYMNGYTGRDLSGSGWGLKWDFIIVHESGHEWFANSITTKDIADMWVHEGFTDYSETLFTEYYYGKEAGNDYNAGLRKNIANDEPIIGPYGVNKEGSSDMYYKGANMLHAIRHAINNDSLFRSILRGLNSTFYHQTVTTQQIESFISEKAGYNFQKVFDQYLRTIQVPHLEYTMDTTTGKLQYRWSNCVDGFNLPIVIVPSSRKLFPTQQWQTAQLTNEEAAWWNKANIERQYYIVAEEK